MEGNRLKLLEASDANSLRVIERAIRFGEPVLIQVSYKLLLQLRLTVNLLSVAEKSVNQGSNGQ